MALVLMATPQGTTGTTIDDAWTFYINYQAEITKETTKETGLGTALLIGLGLWALSEREKEKG